MHAYEKRDHINVPLFLKLIDAHIYRLSIREISLPDGVHL